MKSWFKILVKGLSAVNDVKDLAEQYKYPENRKEVKRTYYFQKRSWAITMILVFLGFLFSLFLIFGDTGGFEGALRQIVGVILAIYTGVHFAVLLLFTIIEIVGYKIEDKWREKHKENVFEFEEETEEEIESNFFNDNKDYENNPIKTKENINNELNENGFIHEDDDD